MKNIFLVLGFLLVFGLQVDAQSIRVTEAEPITEMMEKFVELNRSRTFVDGWRIQILATTDRQRLEAARQRFQYRYPNVAIDWVHSNPHYKLRAGAFSTKLEALRLKYILEREYSGIYLVKDDKIRPSELLNSF